MMQKGYWYYSRPNGGQITHSALKYYIICSGENEWVQECPWTVDTLIKNGCVSYTDIISNVLFTKLRDKSIYCERY